MHPLKTLEPTEASDAGKLTDASLPHPENASFPMSSTLSPRTAEVSPLQFLNALSPIETTLPGSETAARETHPLNAPAPISVREVPHAMFFRS